MKITRLSYITINVPFMAEIFMFYNIHIAYVASCLYSVNMQCNIIYDAYHVGGASSRRARRR